MLPPRLVGRQEGHPACKKLEWWGAGVVICLDRGADLHMVQLMPLPLTVSCFSKIQIGFTFLVPAHLGSPGKRPVKRGCVPYGIILLCHIVCFCCWHRCVDDASKPVAACYFLSHRNIFCRLLKRFYSSNLILTSSTDIIQLVVLAVVAPLRPL